MKPTLKFAFILWLFVYPLITVLVWLERALLGPIPFLLSTAITSAIFVPIMTFVVVPCVHQIYAKLNVPRTAQKDEENALR